MTEAKGASAALGANGAQRSGEYALMDPRFGKLGSPGLDRISDASLFSRVLGFLSGPDVARAGATSMGWSHAANDPALWKALYARAFTGVGTPSTVTFPSSNTGNGPPLAKNAFRDRCVTT